MPVIKRQLNQANFKKVLAQTDGSDLEVSLPANVVVFELQNPPTNFDAYDIHYYLVKYLGDVISEDGVTTNGQVIAIGTKGGITALDLRERIEEMYQKDMADVREEIGRK